MELRNASQTAQRWEEALAHVQQALEILDSSDAPMEISCHLDLAKSRLQDSMYGKVPASMIAQLREEMKRVLDSSEAVAEFA
jgi:hypothetical protein